MKIDTTKLVDSALVTAILSALLYFLGVANLSGDSAVLEVPPGLLSRNPLGTIAYGAEGLVLYTVLLPLVLLVQNGQHAHVLVTLAVAFAAVAAVYWLARKSAYRTALVGVAIFFGLSVHITQASTHHMISRKVAALECVHRNNCVGSEAQKKVVFKLTDTTSEERIGVLLATGDQNVAMLTRAGAVFVPRERILYVEDVLPLRTK